MLLVLRVCQSAFKQNFIERAITSPENCFQWSADHLYIVHGFNLAHIDNANNAKSYTDRDQQYIRDIRTGLLIFLDTMNAIYVVINDLNLLHYMLNNITFCTPIVGGEIICALSWVVFKIFKP